MRRAMNIIRVMGGAGRRCLMCHQSAVSPSGSKHSTAQRSKQLGCPSALSCNVAVGHAPCWASTTLKRSAAELSDAASSSSKTRLACKGGNCKICFRTVSPFQARSSPANRARRGQTKQAWALFVVARRQRFALRLHYLHRADT